MKFHLLILCFVSMFGQKALAQANLDSANRKQQEKRSDYPDFDRTLLLESKSDTTANVSFGDLDGDGHLDILLVKGRHWPIIDKVLLGDGSGGIRKSYSLGTVADFDEDGMPDIAAARSEATNILYFGNVGSKSK